MKYGEAKALIKRTMGRARATTGRTSADALQEIGESEAIQAFDALERQGDGAFVGADDNLKAFLWEFARSLSASTPAHDQHPDLLLRVIAAYEAAAGIKEPRAHELRIGLLNRRIAAEHGFRPDAGWPGDDGRKLQEEFESLRGLNLTEEQRTKLEQSSTLFAGRRTDVYSTIAFELPHPLVRRPTCVTLDYEGAEVRIDIRPTSAAPDMIAFAEGVHHSLTVLGGGAWPPGVSEVLVVFRGLIDWTASVESYEDPAVSSSGGRSPAIPQLVADVLRAALLGLQVRADDELDGYWMPVANDVRQYQLQIGTATDPTAYYMHHLTPGGARATVLDGPSFEIDLGTVELPRPWQAARVYAHGALRSARYFDAVVWTNVAIEAYIDEVLAEISGTPGVDASELARGSSLFAEAEEIVARAHPHLAGTIEWPTTEKAPSRYRQISAAARLATMGTSKKVLQNLYSAIASQRNDAVHGRSIDSVPAQAARAALEALDAFVEKFRVTPPLIDN
ncbi:hypothetical protein [Microbacterium sp. NPDC077184]|uniref:hypothetical protein n=1 Tax=Microbacterium sp. NPDC077184 TaxID=3154764 RepID=UPI0034469DFD